MSKTVNKWGIPNLSGKEVRQSFIDFFRERGHTFVASSPVVPHDDPTLLFINSGMNQFKSIFLGDNRLGLKRAVNSQKCLRVSGKHNDLDEVGRDTYHHTFFEMLGNWSFGDYYKKEAIRWSWELLTQVWGLPKDRLFATIYKDDDEAEAIWKSETDIDHTRILRFGEKSNFWEMGDVGPCGPCTEIHFDMGDLETQAATFADPVNGVNGANARYIEIWNNVFMQYERLQNGDLKPLVAKHVDTGMGFERVLSIIQGTGSNYETDVFRPLIDRIAETTGIPYDQGPQGTPHRVIADHLRALAFAIADGATPGNEGRGYVLRRILRRASRFSQELNQKDPFIYRMLPTLVNIMGDAFPELKQRQDYIAQVIHAEEERFMRTLRDGLARFSKIAIDTKQNNKTVISGYDAFVLYDTYGFPVDLTGVLAEEQGLTIDHRGFASAMEEQRERARSAAKFDASLASDEGWTIISPQKETRFVGYHELTCESRVTRFCEVGDEVLICLDRSPFYAESGGQVGDTGWLRTDEVELKVVNTFKVLEMHVHKCVLIHGLLGPEKLRHLRAQVDVEARAATVRNHSATHLLHAALHQVLGEHVQQQGSRVAPESLRFDFTQPRGLTDAELAKVEFLVNREIMANRSVLVAEKSLEEAKREGAVALFGEKYGDRVRTIKMGEFSHELCGGTHAEATGQIGSFRITAESSIAAGIRRIEAITGFTVVEQARKESYTLLHLAQTLKTKPEDLELKIQEMNEKLRSYDKELKSIRLEQVNQRVDQMLRDDLTTIGKGQMVLKKLDASTFIKETHQAVLDSLAAKLGNGVAVLTHVEDGTLSILVAVGTEARNKIKAGDLIKDLCKVADGRGGGRPDKAQAGSKSLEKEPTVLNTARELLAKSFV
ncbi:MAG: alanine--tRNA ligase [Deltaproteobacteria bacterium]|nr:alanine--tRNA ligase [Deltaproteobacteria bacterium]